MSSREPGFSQTGFWQQTSGPIGGKVSSFAVNTLTQHIFAGTRGAGVFQSGDNGENWQPKSNGLSNVNVTALIANASGHLFAGTFSGIFRSVDNGGHWTETSFGLMSGEDIYALAVMGNGDIFAGTRGHGVYRSTDNGETWRAVNAGLNNLYVRTLATNASGHLYAGTDGNGVFRSANRGESWESINSGLTSLYVWSLAVDKNGFVFAGTDGDGVFRSRESTTSIEEINVQMPQKFFLRQNYPNPFNKQTTISMDVPLNAGGVEVTIFNIQGQKIITLLNAGLHSRHIELKWDGKDTWGRTVSPGIYFCRLRTGNQIQTRKLFLNAKSFDSNK